MVWLAGLGGEDGSFEGGRLGKVVLSRRVRREEGRSSGSARSGLVALMADVGDAGRDVSFTRI